MEALADKAENNTAINETYKLKIRVSTRNSDKKWEGSKVPKTELMRRSYNMDRLEEGKNK